MQLYDLRADCVAGSPATKVLSVLLDKLNMSCQCALAAKEAKCTLGSAARVEPAGPGKGSSPLFGTCETTSGVLHPVSRLPGARRIVALWIESRSSHQDGWGLEHRVCEVSLGELDLFSLKNRRLRGDLFAAYCSLIGGYRWVGSRFFLEVHGYRAKNNGHKWNTGNSN